MSLLSLLNGYDNYDIPHCLRNILKYYKYYFNPSIVIHDNITYIAIRIVTNVDNKKIINNIYIIRNNLIINIIKLDEYVALRYSSKVADPKLFIMNNNVYCTFNSGYSNNINNHIYLALINNNNIVNCFLCNIENRNIVEKNWMFYHDKENIYMIYSITPTLKIYKSKYYTDSKIYFKMYKEIRVGTSSKVSIGSPLVSLDNINYHLFCHYKYFFKNKRIYVAIPVKINIISNKVIVYNKRYVHSINSIFGSRVKFNNNLISCTYISGIQFIDRKKLILGYGVNDIKYYIKIIPSKLIGL